ncbi:endonuclease domain-containing protein [Frankia sp. R82]|uniref:endonuclease domain-containing protein n=1 Tax=Frankia sp. R82 TaxID=2950553 RepID=UPI002043D33C|nr:DUF559 domain-containing protein [Frankia sp. R82]MCM3882786.1 DUF559 domain-containing protein [Frankia sp. R82]
MKSVDLPTELRRLSRRQDGMLTWPQVRAAGITRWQFERMTREHGWATPCRGTVLLPGAHPVRGPARAALVGRPDAVICGPTAADLLMLPGLPRSPSPGSSRQLGPSGPGRTAGRHTTASASGRGAADQPSQKSNPVHVHPVHVLVPLDAHGSGDIRGLVRHRGTWRPDELESVHGIPATGVIRTLVDLVRTSDRVTAVGLLDAALRHGRIAELDPVIDAAVGRKGMAERYGWFALVDGRAESPLETWLRLLLLDAGLVPEALQWPVWRSDPMSARIPEGVGAGGLGAGFSDDWAQAHSCAAPVRSEGPSLGGDWHPREQQKVLARIDLAWPSRLVAVEVDGAVVHEQPQALFRDRTRQNDLMALGWVVLRFTWADLLHRPQSVVEQVRHALRAPRRLPCPPFTFRTL